MSAARIAYLNELITALQTATLAIVGGEFSEIDAVEQRFRTHDPAKLETMRQNAERELRVLEATGGRGGLVLRQGR
jgi:hypothetical protein